MMGKSPRPCRLMVLLALILLALTLPGCSQPPAEAVAAGDAAASLQEIPGSDVKRIVLTERAVGNIGLQTSTTSTDPKSRKLTVPYLAILYDSQGKTWVYTNPEPRVYVRQPVTVARIDGEVAQLSGGPAPGTTVVTLGAEELFGAELDTAN
ncbi:hypothetical protein ASG92_24225 [Arthrobacter sp. Soil736]|uniref:hypothetical protein n=1 Tax=Arthrobacter sp. Soil736 TaxID=1736395 RepID=UPI0006F65D24|nr:hypothetical protein [Arthrobacter sp. Soil736]KRE55791.1 hypothetical protein ASG92_24225 [Arthrobacter sp. Soil736]